jgi:hypothetical protein
VLFGRDVGKYQLMKHNSIVLGYDHRASVGNLLGPFDFELGHISSTCTKSLRGNSIQGTRTNCQVGDQ